MSRRIVRRPLAADQDGLPTGLHPLLRRVYLAREVLASAELDLGLASLHPVQRLKGAFEAAALLREAIEAGRRILVVGDFDADGATSCALAVRALGAMGAGNLDYLVPNRFEFGYGLTPEIVAVAARDRPDLIVTVDNGIASHTGVQCARELGIQVVITDHHLPGATLPEAAAIVNPNQPGDLFPSKHLAGVGVIFYVLAALRQALRDSGWFRRRGLTEPNLAGFLDLVALGTVADLVPLDHNNRILVAQGLHRIRAGACTPGIQALLAVAGRSPQRVVASDLGFAVGPRLNAAGRLEDMAVGIECLLSDDSDRAMEIAGRLDALNRERRGIEARMKSEAEELLHGLGLQDSGLPLGLCLFDPSWHQGVIGILAARIRERFHRPVIALAPADDQRIKGSARSVPGLHIRDALDAIATRHPQLLERFGGHAMAAGLSLHRQHLEAFSEAFDAEARRRLGDRDPVGEVLSDGELAAEYLDLETAELLRNGGPWGQGFPEPLFDGRFRLLSQRIVGEKHLKMSLQSPGGERSIDAIAFNYEAPSLQDLGEVEVAYRLSVNEYRGERQAQLIVDYLRPA